MTTEEFHPMRRRSDLKKSRLGAVVAGLCHRGRRERFRDWRTTPAIVTRGYLAFRDFVVFGLCAAMVVAGIVTVRDLRSTDCRTGNDRRANIRDATLELVENDRFLIELADSLSEEGLPPEFKLPLLARYARQASEIKAAYKPMTC